MKTNRLGVSCPWRTINDFNNGRNRKEKSQMSRLCRECKKGTLEITGMGAYEDTILVQCPECGEEYELEPDGFGEGGMELVEAFEIEQKSREQEEKEDADG
jgi:hypothetical protein